MTLRVLLVGDLHLGRRPTRLPPEAASPPHGTWGEALSARAAWERTVELALDKHVHAVLLAGDVVEKNEDRFQAFGPLEAGVRRLREAGMEVLGIAGNHDDVALPRLAQRIEGFRFLGRDGTFELARVETNAGTFGVLGWSFPKRSYPANPLDTLGEELKREVEAFEDGPVLGLLHTQLDIPSGSYAPTRRTQLEDVPTAGWFLGHVHRPSLGAGAVAAGTLPLGYLGSVSGCDIGEAGARGPWLATIEDGRLACLEHLGVTPVRFEFLELDVSDCEENGNFSEEAAMRSLQDGTARLASEAAAVARAPEALALRLRLTGASTHHRTSVEHFRRLVSSGDWWYESHGIVCYLEGIRDEARPALDLEQLASGQGPIGLMARRVLALERNVPGDPEQEDADHARMRRAAHDLLEDLLAARVEA